MNIGNRLRDLRNKKGMTQEAVGERLGVNKATVNRYETGVIDIKRTIAIKLADILNSNPAYIMGWSDDPAPIITHLPKNMRFLENASQINVPVIGRVAAGLSCYAEENIVEYEPFPASEIVPGEEYVCLRVVGDSMYPKFEEGDTVLVRVQPSVDSGSYAVVIIDGEDGVIKRVVYDDDYIELQSINPMYPPRRFEGADVLRIHVFGLVKEIKRKF